MISFHKRPIILALFFLSGFLNQVQLGFAETEKQLSVFVSIIPEVYFVERIGGDRVKVNALVQPGQNPATYSPTPQQMTRLAQSDIYFRIGVPFEKSLIPKIKKAIPHLVVKDLREGIDLMELRDHDDENENGDHIDPHTRDSIDPHTWLDPMLVKQQSKIIRNTLIELDPGRTIEYENNYRKFANDLETLDNDLRETLRPFSGQTIYVFHPAYGYFCRAYNLKQQAVSIDGKNPGAKHIGRLIQKARDDKVGVIFVQPQFSKKTARAIAQAIGAAVIALDPLAQDYLVNMKHIAKEIKLSLGTLTVPKKSGTQ